MDGFHPYMQGQYIIGIGVRTDWSMMILASFSMSQEDLIFENLIDSEMPCKPLA